MHLAFFMPPWYNSPKGGDFMNRVSQKITFPLVVICLLVVGAICLYNFLPMTYLHGAQLNALSDGKLLKTVHSQNLQLLRAYGDEKTALENMDPVRKAVYVLTVYEKEVEGGGLCLFFVNDTRSVAPYVAECLAAVGAQEHLALYSEFIADNAIDTADLSSFIIGNIEEFDIQEKRYDFASFNDQYLALPSLKPYIIAYIRANIDCF